MMELYSWQQVLSVRGWPWLLECLLCIGIVESYVADVITRTLLAVFEMPWMNNAFNKPLVA